MAPKQTNKDPPSAPIRRQWTRALKHLSLAIMGACLFRTAITYFGLLGHSNAAAFLANTKAPTVTVKNGTYVGEYNSFYKQDFFKGMAYAQPPIGDLRFHVALPLNSSWNGIKNATEFLPHCVGYGSDQTEYETSEDCLALNVVCPAGASNLPVLVWIHGGGLYEGGGADLRYNMSFIIQNSVKTNNPMIGVNINYRLSAWGFLYSDEVQKAGATNLGLRDQRLALHWVQENIAAFGGDPEKVTIFGESAGGLSVGAHLYAYGGRDDSLFRGAISNSGTVQSYSPYANSLNTQEQYNSLVSQTGCGDSSDTLQCLRELPYNTLNDVVNASSATFISQPAIDGDFIQDFGSVALSTGKFLKVPYLTGTNTDENSGFITREGWVINTDTEFLNFVQSRTYANNSYGLVIPYLYPDIPSIGLPPSFLANNERPVGDYAFLGSQYKRAVSYLSDYMFHNNRRAANQAWSKFNVTNYSYRFNIIPAGSAVYDGVSHFQEVAFVFNNIEGIGYEINPFQGMPKSYVEASTLMTRMWSSFVTHLDPNFHGLSGQAAWPVYSNTFPTNFVFDANVTSYVEEDTWRAEGMQYMIDFANEMYSR